MKVELIDSMGNDLSVVNAARVSFHKVSDEFTERDEGLIRYLAKHDHWTPFSQVQYQVRIKAPIFVARQWFKHMIGITRNEVSRRYVSDTPTFWLPPVDSWRKRPDSIKQGSEGKIESDEIMWQLDRMYEEVISNAHSAYRYFIQQGVCPEQARALLPQSMMTEWVETGSLAAAARIYKQRTDSHAQLEIQQLAEKFGAAVKDIAPMSWKELT